MRISDWSSDVCSSDLRTTLAAQLPEGSRYLGQVRRRLFAASRSGRPVELCGYLPVYQLPASTGSGPACRVLLPEGFDPQTRLHAGLVAELERALAHHGVLEIGRASCRERVCQYVLNSVVAGSLKKNK